MKPSDWNHLLDYKLDYIHQHNPHFSLSRLHYRIREKTRNVVKMGEILEDEIERVFNTFGTPEERVIYLETRGKK